MKKHLIINADDFGMSKEVNDGTKRGITQGIITSVSVMVNMPYFEDAVTFLKKHPEISVGLHFNITEGTPLLLPREVKDLLREDNTFQYWQRLIPRIPVNKEEMLKQIKAELSAQCLRLQATGLRITHIDSHHHVHLYPSVFRVVSDFADKQHIHSLRGNEFNFWNLMLGIWKKPILTQLIVNMFLLLDTYRYKNRSHLYKIQRFYDINWAKEISPEQFAEILEKLPSGTTEFICHLATVSKTGNSKFLVPRYNALQLLTQPIIKKHLMKNGITLIPHSV